MFEYFCILEVECFEVFNEVVVGDGEFVVDVCFDVDVFVDWFDVGEVV